MMPSTLANANPFLIHTAEPSFQPLPCSQRLPALVRVAVQRANRRQSMQQAKKLNPLLAILIHLRQGGQALIYKLLVACFIPLILGSTQVYAMKITQPLGEQPGLGQRLQQAIHEAPTAMNPNVTLFQNDSNTAAPKANEKAMVNAFDEALFTEPSPQSLRQEPDTITTNHDVEALRHALATHTDPADTETADTDVLSREAHHSIHHPLHHLRITSHFGPRWGRHHRGTDFAAAKGTPILAAQEGVVRFAGWQGGYGKLVIVDHGHGLTTRYGHCSKITVSAGQQVGQGEMIARVGSTGHSTGPHLHFEVRHNEVAVNPMNELA